MTFVATVFFGIVNLLLRLAGFRHESAADQVEGTNHAMLKDAVNRSSDADVSRSLHDGTY